MTGDVAILFNATTQSFDWAQNATGDICDTQTAGLSDLESAIVVAVFTDKKVPPDWVFQQKGILNDPRGWWGDADSDFPIGSNLWLLKYQSGAGNLLQIARGYVEDALQFLLDNGIAAAIQVVTSWIFPNSTRAIGIAITITEPITNIRSRFQYSYSWQTITNLAETPPSVIG